MGKNRDGTHPGETGHAEGQHGDKTHRAFIEQLQSGRDEAPTESIAAADTPGRHRLRENREQHDEADKNSEINRLNAEVQRGRLDPDLPGVGDRLNGEKPGQQ